MSYSRIPGHYLERLYPLDSIHPVVDGSYKVSRLKRLQSKPTFSGEAKINFKRTGIGKAILKSAPVKVINFKRAGRSKEIHLTPSMDAGAYSAVLTRTYNHLVDGARLEMHVRFTKDERKNYENIDHVLSVHPHLRPEPILKGMPGGTVISYEPLFDKRLTSTDQIMWVMANEENWKGMGAKGWKRSPRAPPTEKAVEILKGLPVIEARRTPAVDTRTIEATTVPSADSKSHGGVGTTDLERQSTVQA
ncbi:MAG: hypothetical protein Q9218_003110 [Villophora microphyllina]